MGKISLYATLIATFGFGIIHGEKEVLIRDRLVMVLCDQRDEYLDSGSMPEPVKIMPEKYKNFKPGQGNAAGRVVAGVKPPGGSMIKPNPGADGGMDEENGVVGGGRGFNRDGTSMGNPNQPAPTGRRSSKSGRNAGKNVYEVKSLRNKRASDILQMDFEACSKDGVNCVLDLDDGM